MLGYALFSVLISKKQAVYTWKKQAIKGRLLPVFGGKLVTTITPGMIEEYRATRRMEKGLLGTTIKIATINRAHALLNHLFNFAIRDGCLEQSPVRLVRFEKENNARGRVLSLGKFEQLQSHSALHLQAINLTLNRNAGQRNLEPDLEPNGALEGLVRG